LNRAQILLLRERDLFTADRITSFILEQIDLITQTILSFSVISSSAIVANERTNIYDMAKSDKKIADSLTSL
jgi:hypothetical protein